MFESRKTNNYVCGINDSAFEKTILKCSNTAEQIRKKFDEIEHIMSNIQDFYACSGSTTLFQKFNDFKLNFAIVANNIDIYESDLTKAKNNFHEMINSAAEIIKYDK